MAKIEWAGPYSFRELFENEELSQRWQVSGVYLWVDPSTKEYNIFYIGKALGKPTITQRQFQHYIYQIGGAYSIPEHARTSRKPWGYNVTQAEVKEVVLNNEAFLEIVRDGFSFAHQIQLYFAKVEKALAVIVEANLIYDLQPTSNTSGRGRIPKDNPGIVHVNAHWASDEARKRAEGRGEVFT